AGFGLALVFLAGAFPEQAVLVARVPPVGGRLANVLLAVAGFHQVILGLRRLITAAGTGVRKAGGVIIGSGRRLGIELADAFEIFLGQIQIRLGAGQLVAH